MEDTSWGWRGSRKLDARELGRHQGGYFTNAYFVLIPVWHLNPKQYFIDA